MQKLFLLLFCFGHLIWLGGCVNVPSHQQRVETADQLAASSGWQQQLIETSLFKLVTYTPEDLANNRTSHGELLTIYIEGDGLAWVSRSRVSSNPTPTDPMSLKLALQHPGENVAYLARPCQYTKANTSQNCQPKFWTDARFSPEVINASNEAVSALKKLYDASGLQLIGYSGGGSVAALIAAQRDDVKRLITVAGNLDHSVWTKKHRISPLMNSLNPADAWPTLKNIPQVHIIGGKDQIVSVDVLDSYLGHFYESSEIKFLNIPEYTHFCCWVEDWKSILSQAVSLLEIE